MQKRKHSIILRFIISHYAIYKLPYFVLCFQAKGCNIRQRPNTTLKWEVRCLLGRVHGWQVSWILFEMSKFHFSSIEFRIAREVPDQNITDTLNDSLGIRNGWFTLSKKNFIHFLNLVYFLVFFSVILKNGSFSRLCASVCVTKLAES